MLEFITQYWLETLFGGITLALSAVVNLLKCKVRENTKEQESIKLGIQALLRDRIIQAYNKYYDQEFIPIYGMDNVEAMYKEYHNLGGNGTVTKLVETLRDLPTEPKKGVRHEPQEKEKAV